jgi:poly(3-hydroxyalkanoate) synthetase
MIPSSAFDRLPKSFIPRRKTLCSNEMKGGEKLSFELLTWKRESEDSF